MTSYRRISGPGIPDRIREDSLSTDHRSRMVMKRDSFDEGNPNPVTVPSIRLVLAAAMLVVTRIDPSEPAL
ncbi:MAG: hypothetical protein Kow001_18920 [Acidobacteriota bacterium]